MKAAEVIRNVRKLYKVHYVSVNKVWTSYRADTEGNDIVEKFSLSIQPGFDGTDCQIFYGDTLEECVEKLAENASDHVMKASKQVDTEDEPRKANKVAINVYDANWVLVETYTLVDTWEQARDIAERDSVQLSGRSQKGMHIRIDELDANGDYLPGTVGHCVKVVGTKVPTVTA